MQHSFTSEDLVNKILTFQSQIIPVKRRSRIFSYFSWQLTLEKSLPADKNNQSRD